MTTRWNRFLITAFFGFATLAAGCAARDVEVSQRGPIRGEATIQGDRTTTDNQQTQKKSARSFLPQFLRDRDDR